MTIKQISVALIALGLAAGAAQTQTVDKRHASQASGIEQGIASGMTLDQFLTRQTSRVMAADTDGDGKISRAERDATARNGREPSRRFDAMDGNHDGSFDVSEARDVLTQRFHRLDRNGDGMLTPNERMAGRGRARQAVPADPTARPQL